MAPLTAAALLAQQVASNALRDALFLTWFPVTTLPYFIAAAAILAIPRRSRPAVSSPGSGRLAVVPSILGLNSPVPGGMESARRTPARGLGARLLSRQRAWRDRDLSVLVVAQRALRPAFGEGADGASGRGGRLGGLAGGVGAERVTALMSQGALFLSAGTVGRGLRGGFRFHRARYACAACTTAGARGDDGADGPRSGACHCCEISRWWSRSPPHSPHWWTICSRRKRLLVGKGRAPGAFLRPLLRRDRPRRVPAAGPVRTRVLARIGLGGSVASHPLLVGAAGLLGFMVPAPWRGILPRGLDVTLRASVFRAGYELFYTPLPEAAKRAAKSAVDVSADCLGKGAGAALIVLLTRLVPLYTFVAVNLAGVLAAGAEFPLRAACARVM